MGGKQLRLWAALKLPDKRREPEEGDVETGRGKKGKKAWQLNLRLIDVICAGIGIVGLMCMSFALGALAGRGDIYRAAYSLGLLSPEAKQLAQITPQMAPAPPVAEAPVMVPAGTPAAAPAPAAAPSQAAPPATAAAAASAKSPHPAPVTASMAPVTPPAAAASSKKKAKSAQAQHEQKAREEQLRQHTDVAKKMTFLNSFDSTPKPSQKKDKATAAKPQPTQVKVGTYRDSKTAQAKLAELQKKGVKASVKQSKDAKGACYTVYRPAPAAPAKEADKVAQSKEKTASAGRKPQAE